jgi:LmbE family N-acetylglucosaminyl deacetylase
MSLTGLEQMSYLARTADVANGKSIEKDKKRTLKMKSEELERQRRIERSQAVLVMGESDKIEALSHQQHPDQDGSHGKKGDDPSDFSKKREYYNDPSLGSHIDISS